MKKRLLSILFTLAVCLGLLSVTALAAETEGDITVNDTQVTSSNQNDVFGDGKVSYDPDTNALSVNGFQGGNLTISGNGSTDVVISGTSNAPFCWQADRHRRKGCHCDGELQRSGHQQRCGDYLLRQCRDC